MPEPADEASPLLEALAEYLRHDGSRSEAERRSLLEAHPDLRDELASFLDDEAAVFGVASSGLSDGIAGPRDEAETSFAFGGYDVQGPIARGGMGVVFLAREVRLNRLVALKILPGGGFAPPQDRRRFQREAELVAALDHPHIVPVYAVGEHAGHAYLAMKLVAGGSLAAHLEAFRGDPRGAASLLRQVALAVQHAHERGVLHLDLKPSNVLLEGDGRPLVADFGLARRAGHGAELTWTGAVVGTPGYMAPEQASGRREEVSAATDVYGLGALLYALLTGRPPFVGDTPAEVIDRVRHGEPLPPCRLARGIPPDLEAITLCCLERDPAARYATAQEVADDLERHLAGLPVHARTRPAFVRLGKYLGRRRGRVALVLTVALVGVLAVVAAIESRRASEQQQATARLAIEINRGQAALARADYATRFGAAARLVDAGRFAEARDALARLVDARAALDPASRGVEWSYLRRQAEPGPGIAWVAHEGRPVYHIEFSRDGSLMATAGGDGTGRVWTMVPGVASPTLRRTFRVPVGDVNSAMFSPDATRLVTAGDDMHVRLWEVDTGRLLATFVHHGDAVVAASFTPDGRDIIAVYRNGALTRWDAATSQLRGEVASPALRIEGMTLDREGRTLFLMGSDVLRTVSLAPDGSFGPFTHAVVSEGGQCVALSPDSKRLAVAVRGNVSARIVDRAQPARTLDLVGPYAEGFGVAFSPDGKTLAAVDKTGTLRTWDASTGAGLLATCVHRGRVWAVAYAPDGRLVTGGDDGTVRLFDPSQPVGRIVVRGLRDAPGATAAEMVLSDDGRRLLACDSRGAVLEVDLPLVPGAGTPAHREFAPPASELISTAASLSPGGRYLLLRGRHTDPKRGHEIELYERRPGQPLARTLVIPRSPAESQLAWSTDGRHLAVNDETRCLVLWDIPGGRSLAKGPSVSEFYLEGVTFTASGDGVVVVGVDRTVKPWRHAVVRWDHRHGRSSRTLTTGLAAHDVWDETRSLALAPDGETLVALGAFRAFPVAIDLGTNTVAGEFIGAAAATADLAISPDGQRLATAHADGEVRLWDLHGRQLLLTLRGHARPARGVAFTPDGRWLLSLAEGPDVGIEVALWPVGP